jgi:tetratricopeptide (TPR) repeat protein
MTNLGTIVVVLHLILVSGLYPQLSEIEGSDTSSINNLTRNALINARRNPDVAIMMAHKALAESKNTGFKEGIADAYLALGNAWLAKYNPGDSAFYYNKLAYENYTRLNDYNGIARACYALAYVFSFKGDLNESEYYSNLSLEHFNKSGDKRGIINSYSALSYLAKQQKDFDKAQVYIHKAIETASSIKDTLPLADATNSLGNIYKDMALFKQAIDAYFEALSLWEIKGDSNGISIAYGSIGLMYYYQKEWDKALEFNLKKLSISKAAGDLWETSKTYNTIAQIYNAENEYDSALIYLRKGLILNEKMNYPTGIASSFHNIAAILLRLSQIDSALFYAQNSVEIARETDDYAIVDYYITLGNVLQARKQYKEALQNALMAYNLARKQNLPLTVSDASALISDIYTKLDRDDLAYRYLKEHTQLRDSISNDEFLKQVTRLEIQYDFDKKQKEAEFARIEEKIRHENEIREKNLYLYGLLALLLLLILISFLYIRHNRLQAQYERIGLEQRLLRAQMNPHFMFNSLCAVQDFILADKTNEANNFLTKIAKLMRNILENSREEFIPLSKEIETVRLYLDLQKLRFEYEFQYDIALDDAIDPENISVPPMFTQPCVENSIEHGLLPLKEKGKLEISYLINNGLIRLEISDNGIGRTKAAERALKKGSKRSVSTLLIEERLAYYRKTLKKKKIGMQIVDLLDNTKPAGTKIAIMLPYTNVYS